MDLTSLETLDFTRVRRQVCAFCLTEEGPLALENEKILNEEKALDALKKSVQPFFDLLARGVALPKTPFPAIAAILEHLALDGSVLDGFKLKSLARYIALASQWKNFLASQKDKALGLWALSLEDFSIVGDAIDRVFDHQGEVIQDAVPVLMQLKKETIRTQKDIDQIAHAWLKSPEHCSLWSGINPVQKDKRTVLPLKSSFKTRLPSLIHGASASGATLFVEPYNLVEKNNRLTELAYAWKIEMQKLLRDFTKKVREHHKELLTLCKTMTQLDLLLARARWGDSVKGVFPQTGNSQKPWKLLQARHPFLGEQAVPIDLEIIKDVKILLISGPNTGGKTVFLKTVGLLSLLHQFGLPIPADEQSVLPIWDTVLTEMGDGQSLEEGLSTFSSHMKRMSFILQTATHRSLVLLDEMASGTDPLEGGALGISFLEHFLEHSITVLGTTHHGALKNYAYTQAGAQNAAVEFDSVKERPTYRLLTDVPGASYALETAQRVGIPIKIILHSKIILEEGQTDIARTINALKEKELKLQTREKEIETREKEFRNEKQQADLLQLRLKQYKNELKHQDLRELKLFLSESRCQFEALVKDIRTQTLTSEKIKDVRTLLANTKQKIEDEKIKWREEQLAAQKDHIRLTQPLAPGLEVWIEPEHQKGTIIRQIRGDKAQIAVGSVKMTLSISRLRLVHSPTFCQKKSLRVEIHAFDGVKELSPVFNLDVRGFRLDVALIAVEKQIDLALLKGLAEFSVIHGLGEGVLQKGVQEYLRQRSEVKNFFFSHPQEGGFGKTIVQL